MKGCGIMAIEKSVLSESEILLLMRNTYGIAADRVQKIHLGSANCFKIFAKGTSYFLKEYQKKFSEQDLCRETALVKYLILHHFPTAEFIKDKNGNLYNLINGKYVVLQEFIEGKCYDDHDIPDHLLFEAAKILGQLHEILNGYDLPVEMGNEWINNFNVSKSCDKYNLLLNKAQNIEDSSIRNKIYDDLTFKKDLLRYIEPYGQYFDKLTYKSTHGDYNRMQYLCSKDRIEAIIDFATAKKIPAVWEVMRSYIQSAGDTNDPFNLDTSKFLEYVRYYMQFSVLTEYDLKYMPYVYLYQLGRSRYGYSEYMENAENKDNMLNFAFWRTNTCRMLVDKADDLSKSLIKLKL